MAITITDKPFDNTPVGQRLMIVATSTNVAEPGFRYKVDVVISGITSSFYIPPNVENVLIFDVANLFNLELNEKYNNLSIHSIDVCDADNDSTVGADVSIYEAWEVSGVLTDDPDTLGAENAMFTVWTASFQANDGYKPALTRFVMDGETKQWLSDRQWNTHTWNYAETFGLTFSNNKVFIPTTDADWGVMNTVPILSAGDGVKVTLVQENGTPVSFTQAGLDGYSVCCVYAANMNINVMGFPKPIDYPNWRYYTVQAVNGGGISKSVLYVFYNATLWGNTDCRYDRIRLAWVGSGGSWEYLNFTKKNEESIEIERKRYQQVLGTYGTSFTQNGMQRGLTEVGNITKRLLTINSDWISEGEFTFLKGLFVSKQVHWVQDDGSFIPMLVEDNQYTEQRTRDGKLKNLTVKLSYANNLWT